MGEQETSQDLPQEWTGSIRFSKSWRVLSESHQQGDFSPDVKGDILDLRPCWQRSKSWNITNPKTFSAKCCGSAV